MEEILSFWFDEGPWTLERLKARTAVWFRANPEFDGTIRERFGHHVEAARRGDYDEWATSARGRVALVLLLDQFPRNIFRGSANAFASDAHARTVTTEGLAMKADAALDAVERFVFYMPLMHAEDAAVHDVSITCFRRLHDEAPAELRPELANALTFAERHAEIVRRFGRYPHRNATLGRPSTPEEIAFLKEPNSSF